MRVVHVGKYYPPCRTLPESTAARSGANGQRRDDEPFREAELIDKWNLLYEGLLP